MGFEPTTFPVSPGRAQQLLNHPAIFPGFYLAFAEHRFAASFELFRVGRAAKVRGFSRILNSCRYGRQGAWHVLCLANVKASRFEGCKGNTPV
jgi:hypothetical protein